MNFDFDDCEFNDLTGDLPKNTLIKVTVDAPNIDFLEIKVSDWQVIMEACILLRKSLHYLEDYSAVLWAESQQNRNLDELTEEIKEIL